MDTTAQSLLVATIQEAAVTYLCFMILLFGGLIGLAMDRRRRERIKYERYVHARLEYTRWRLERIRRGEEV